MVNNGWGVDGGMQSEREGGDGMEKKCRTLVWQRSPNEEEGEGGAEGVRESARKTEKVGPNQKGEV
jgi:hypothetical protein